jgi:hypothetical protein
MKNVLLPALLALASVSCAASRTWDPRTPPYRDADLAPTRQVLARETDGDESRLRSARIDEQRGVLTGIPVGLRYLVGRNVTIPLADVAELRVARPEPPHEPTVVDDAVFIVVHLGILAGFIAMASL